MGVKDLNKSVSFYETLFKSKPTKLKKDYAQWILEDPKINFAISTRAEKSGVDHLGIQVDDSRELNKIREDLDKAEISTHSDGEVTCCYAKSEKSWVTDPNGVAWEAYHTMEDADMYYGEKKTPKKKSACC
jgi:hypothetical protein